MAAAAAAGEDAGRESEEWKKERNKRVTGTDLGKILGGDPYMTRMTLILSKLGHKDAMETASDFTKNLMHLGRAYEPLARSLYLERIAGLDPRAEGVDVFYEVPSLRTHRMFNWFAGTPDLLLPASVLEQQDEPPQKVVEIKCHFYPTMFEAMPYMIPEQVPLRYWLQVQAYMEILDTDDAELWSFTLFGGASLFKIDRISGHMMFSVIWPEVEKFYAVLKKHYKEDAPVTADQIPREDLAAMGWERGSKKRIIEALNAEKLRTTHFVRHLFSEGWESQNSKFPV